MICAACRIFTSAARSDAGSFATSASARSSTGVSRADSFFRAAASGSGPGGALGGRRAPAGVTDNQTAWPAMYPGHASALSIERARRAQAILAGAPWSAVRLPAAPPAPCHTLFTRDFLLFLIGLGAATLGIQIQATVVGYQLYEITRDPLSLGAIGLAEALPFVSLALLGGHVADAVDRRRVVVAAFAVMSVAATVLLALTWRRQALSAGAAPAGHLRGHRPGRRLPGVPAAVANGAVGADRAPRAVPQGHRLAHRRVPAVRHRRPGLRRAAVRLGRGRAAPTSPPSSCCWRRW